VFEKLTSVPERTIFNLFVSAQLPAKNTDQLVHFDMLPTILEFGGFKVDGGRMGLGYSAFNTHADRPPASRALEMDQALMNRSETYTRLWAALAEQAVPIDAMALSGGTRPTDAAQQ